MNLSKLDQPSEYVRENSTVAHAGEEVSARTRLERSSALPLPLSSSDALQGERRILPEAGSPNIFEHLAGLNRGTCSESTLASARNSEVICEAKVGLPRMEGTKGKVRLNLVLRLSRRNRKSGAARWNVPLSLLAAERETVARNRYQVRSNR